MSPQTCPQHDDVIATSTRAAASSEQAVKNTEQLREDFKAMWKEFRVVRIALLGDMTDPEKHPGIIRRLSDVEQVTGEIREAKRALTATAFDYVTRLIPWAIAAAFGWEMLK